MPELTYKFVKQTILEQGDGSPLSAFRLRRFERRRPDIFEKILRLALDHVPNMYEVSSDYQMLDVMTEGLGRAILAELALEEEGYCEGKDTNVRISEAMIIAIISIIISAIVQILVKGDL